MSTLVFPFHDPKNIETKFLKQILPLLKENFDKAFVSVTPKTVEMNPEVVGFLKRDSFFVVNENAADSTIGDHLLSAYKNAVEQSKPDQILHLGYIDRIAFAFLNYKNSFETDLKNVNTPIIFTRSAKAWATHPKNYYAAESMVTEVGKILFGKVIDFGWCHLTLTAKQLADAMPDLTARDMVIVSQLVLSLKNILIMKEVDWLSWEDPFIFGKDSEQYKTERENSLEELEKRMGYVIPQIKYLFEEYRILNNS